VIATIPVGIAPQAIDITPNGAFAYVANYGGTISVIDTATNTVSATVSVANPEGIAVRPDGTFVYVTGNSSNTVAVIDTATNTVTANISVGTGPVLIAFPTRAEADPIDSLITQVRALVAGGSLTQNQAAGLVDKLEEIQTKLDNGHTAAACNQLSSFINQVTALINNGSLTASQGQALIDAANAIKASIGC